MIPNSMSFELWGCARIIPGVQAMNQDKQAPVMSTSTPQQSAASQIKSTLTLSELHDDPAKLAQNLNAVILQYLASCGLEESYSTFCKECDDKEVPFPKELPAPSFPRRTIRQKDAQALLKSFDEENDGQLIALWNTFVKDLEPEEAQSVGQITFYLHVFTAAIVPYRQNRSEAEKQAGMARLTQFFQDKSQTISTDANMLSLYALPFVPDPMSHASFKDIFEDSWKAELRTHVEEVLSGQFEANGMVPGANSELTQMFISYFQQSDDAEGDHEDVDARSEKDALAPTPEPEPTPQEDKSTQKSVPDANDAEVQTDEHDPKSIQFTEALQNAYGHNHRLNLEIQEVRAKLFQTEDRYYKLIQSTAEVVSSLELAVQGKFQSIDALSERLLHVFPELFYQGKGLASVMAENGNKPRMDANDEELPTPSASASPTFVIPRPSSSTNSDELDSLPPKKQATAKKKNRTKIPSKKQKAVKISRSRSISPARENISKFSDKTKETDNMNSNPPRPSQLLPPAALAEQKAKAGHSIIVKAWRQPQPQPQPAPSTQTVTGVVSLVPAPPEKQQQTTATAWQTQKPSTRKTPEGKASSSPRNTRSLSSGAVYPTAAHPITQSTAANAQHQHQHNPFPASGQGRPAAAAISMCPTNLRTQFQPISILKDSQPPSPSPAMKSTYPLRTQTRTIPPEASQLQLQLLYQQPPPGPEGKLGRAKKNFRRDGIRRKPGDGAGAHSTANPRPRAVTFTASTTSGTVISLPQQVQQDNNSNPSPNSFKKLQRSSISSKNSPRPAEAQAKLVLT